VPKVQGGFLLTRRHMESQVRVTCRCGLTAAADYQTDVAYCYCGHAHNAGIADRQHYPCMLAGEDEL